MFKKIIVAFIISGLLGVLFLGFYLKKFITYDKTAEIVYLNIEPSDKKALRGMVRVLARIIYRKATVHNPQGDYLPDQIDDKIKQEIKSKVR